MTIAARPVPRPDHRQARVFCLRAGIGLQRKRGVAGRRDEHFAYETAFQLKTPFHHSNVRLPIALKRVLNLALVTPRMHGRKRRRHKLARHALGPNE
jgi:hypothetical protein